MLGELCGEFAYKYENWIAGTLPSSREYLKWAAAERIEAFEDTAGVPTRLSRPERVLLSRQIDLSLSQRLTRESHDIFRSGLEEQG